MTDKEFRRLKRAELIDIIYELQGNEKKLQEEINCLRQKLEKKELNISKVGSIAEAVLTLNHVFETAQAAADQYIQEVQNTYGKTEAEARDMLNKAKAEADDMLSGAKIQAKDMLDKARSESQHIIEQAETQSKQKWQEFEQKVQQLLQTNKELHLLLQTVQEANAGEKEEQAE